MIALTARGRNLLFALLPFCLFFLYVLKEFGPTDLRPRVGHQKSASDGSAILLQQVLQFIYNPNKFSIQTPSFTYEGGTYSLPSHPRYTKSLGNGVCILDVDTRPFDDENQIFNDTAFDWSNLETHSGGVMNHYMYAKTHGYDYRFYKAPTRDDRHPTWVKVAGIAETLANYQYVVFVDADAIFNQMHIPLEWMLNYWSINSTISLAMAIDPPGEVNEDKYGRRNPNTGFVIAQNNPKTFEILKAWNECPNETRYKGCSEWNKIRFHEQSAFASHVRYDYEEFLKELPCDEANGEWDLDICRGVFISHMWFRTPQLRSHFGDVTLQSLMERAHASAMREKEDILDWNKA